MTIPKDVLQSKDSLNAHTAAFSRDFDPANQTYTDATTTVLQTYDFGDDTVAHPVRTRMPTSGTSNLFPEIKYEYHDGSSTTIQNASPLSTRNDDFQDIMDAILGDATSSATNDGKAIRKIIIQVNNQTGSDQTTDIGEFRIRAFTTVRGAGSAP